MKAGDTSLVVAAFASWHEKHHEARKMLDGGFRLVEHCALERAARGVRAADVVEGRAHERARQQVIAQRQS